MRIQIRRVLLSAFVVSALLLGVAANARADEAADRAALERATQAWIRAFNARDAEALAALATPDIVALDPNVAPLSGREAVRENWARGLRAAQGQLSTSTQEAVIAGDIAWRIGTFVHALPNGDVLGRGQSLEIWKRVNGEWKIHRQMSSSILALPRMLPRPPRTSEPVLDTPRN